MNSESEHVNRAQLNPSQGDLRFEISMFEDFHFIFWNQTRLYTKDAAASKTK